VNCQFDGLGPPEIAAAGKGFSVRYLPVGAVPQLWVLMLGTFREEYRILKLSGGEGAWCNL